ncbi:MAG: zinc-ribbon domain-containing protein [Lachnospiraceae bacterium]|nr:zinc-ribbon domain-containing protein [Lachnospiraceae bacterium]
MKCPKCGVQLPDGMPFCDRCGASINIEESNVESVTTQSAPEQSAPQSKPQSVQQNTPHSVPQQNSYNQGNQVPPQQNPYNQGNQVPPQQNPYNQGNQVPPQQTPYNQGNQVPPHQNPYNQGNQMSPQQNPYNQGNQMPPQQNPYMRGNQMPPQGPYGNVRVYQQGAPKKKGGGCLKAFLIFLIILLLLGAGIFALFKFVIKPKVKKLGDDIKKSGIISSHSPLPSASIDPNTGKDTSKPDNKPEKPKKSKAQIAKEKKAKADKAARKTAKRMSTKRKPNIGDFEWYYKMYYSKKYKKKLKAFCKKKKAKRINNPLLVQGGWKAMMIGAKGKYHTDGDRMFNVVIKNNNNLSGAEVKMDWWIYHDEKGKSYKEKGNGYEDCKWKNKKKTLKGNQLTMDKFISYKGKQYAFGLFQWESGEKDYVILVRR